MIARRSQLPFREYTDSSSPNLLETADCDGRLDSTWLLHVGAT